MFGSQPTKGLSSVYARLLLLVIPVSLSCLFGISNFYIGVSSGITPNMSLAGIIIAWFCLQSRRRRPSPRTHDCRLNNAQTGASAGNAVASALAFTLPAYLLHARAVPVTATDCVLIGLSLLGGSAFALLLVPLMIRTALRGYEKADEPPEAMAIEQLIRSFRPKASQTYLGPILVGAISGLLCGIAISIDPSAFQIELPGGDTVNSIARFGFNPAWIALGVLVGYPTVHALFTGSLLRVILLLTLIVGWNQANESDITEVTSAVNSCAAVLLGIGAAVLLFQLCYRLLRTINKKGEESTIGEIQEVQKVPVWYFFFSGVLTSIGIAAVFLICKDGNAPIESFWVGSVLLLGALLGIVLAERIVSVVGVSVNPSSAIGLLCGGVLAKLLPGTVSLQLVAACGFVIAACSAAADLSQDLWVGKCLKTSFTDQLRVKFFGLLLSVPLIVLLAFSIQSILPTLPVPQGKALMLVVDNIGKPSVDQSTRILVWLGVILFFFCVAIRFKPILIGVGILLPAHISFPLFIGGALAVLLKQSGKSEVAPHVDSGGQDQTDFTTKGNRQTTIDDKTALVTSKQTSERLLSQCRPTMAATLGAFGIGPVVGYALQRLAALDDLLNSSSVLMAIQVLAFNLLLLALLVVWRRHATHSTSNET